MNRKPFYTRSYMPLKPGARVHTVYNRYVMAPTEEAAREALRERDPEALHYKVSPMTDDGGVLLFLDCAGTASAAQVRSLLGQPAPPPKVSKLSPETKRPLGETQRDMLRSLVTHGGWRPGCGWLWDTVSNTKRILESLCKRGLAVNIGGNYTITEKGRGALKESKK